MKTGTRQFFTPSYIDTVDFKKSTAENTKNLKSIRYGVIFKSAHSVVLKKHLKTWHNMDYREEHQISPKAPLAPGGGEAACTTLLPSRRRDEEQGRGVGASTSSTCARTCWY